MEIGIIIQCRTDSNRFPKKILKLIDDKPVLWHVINQCKKTKLQIIISTTTRKMDDPIIEIAKKSKVEFYRGSKNDVLDRYYQTAKKFGLKWIIRITSDCPIIDPNESVKVAKLLKSKKIDYVALDDKTYPDGLDTEGFTFESLEQAWKNAKLSSEREHVSPYIQKNNFKKKIISNKKNLSHLRFTIDYKDDLKFLRAIFSKLKNKENIDLNQILKILERYPELIKINASHKRNEGYRKSIKNDKIIIN
jgi:spore coat polysaccharide biosynthesis protein SpsF